MNSTSPASTLHVTLHVNTKKGVESKQQRKSHPEVRFLCGEMSISLVHPARTGQFTLHVHTNWGVGKAQCLALPESGVAGGLSMRHKHVSRVHDCDPCLRTHT